MFPEIFLERMKQMLGEEYGDFLAAMGQEGQQALRLNSLKGGIGDKGIAENTFTHLTKVPWAENGYYYDAKDQPGKHPYHAAGVYYIQEPSAMAPVELLDIHPGEYVLDLCAAPGGKSTQIAAKLHGKGILVCNEIHSARAKILSENIERMGICNAFVTSETSQRLSVPFQAYFDKILVDAPCSGEGMFRKSQAAREEWSLENVRLCADRQDVILDCAVSMLRPGGRLVYSTCTFSPDENEGSVARLLQRHADVEILDPPKGELGLAGCDGVPAWGEGKPEMAYTLRLWPHRVRGDGHFAAVFQKTGSAEEVRHVYPKNSTVKGIPEKELGEFWRFCQESLQLSRNASLSELGKIFGMDGETAYIRFGDNLYLMPADMPDPKGMKVLRPGLHLGELKKNRFEPSHSLALALPPGNVRRIWNLESESTDVLAYLNGRTFSADGEKGWCLVCVDGFGLGWGKLADGVMKNHYPKGLRINL